MTPLFVSATLIPIAPSIKQRMLLEMPLTATAYGTDFVRTKAQNIAMHVTKKGKTSPIQKQTAQAKIPITRMDSLVKPSGAGRNDSTNSKITPTTPKISFFGVPVLRPFERRI